MKHFLCVLLVGCCLFTPATAAVLPASAPTDATLTKNASPSNTWKLYDLQKISNLTLTPTTFPKNAPGYTPTDKALSSTLAEVPYKEAK